MRLSTDQVGAENSTKQGGVERAPSLQQIESLTYPSGSQLLYLTEGTLQTNYLNHLRWSYAAQRRHDRDVDCSLFVKRDSGVETRNEFRQNLA